MYFSELCEPPQISEGRGELNGK